MPQSSPTVRHTKNMIYKYLTDFSNHWMFHLQSLVVYTGFPRGFVPHVDEQSILSCIVMCVQNCNSVYESESFCINCCQSLSVLLISRVYPTLIKQYHWSQDSSVTKHGVCFQNQNKITYMHITSALFTIKRKALICKQFFLVESFRQKSI